MERPSRPAAFKFDQTVPDDAVILILSFVDFGSRMKVASLVSKRWHRLVHSPELLRHSVEVSICKAPHLERLQALRRWLRRHASSLSIFSLESEGPAGGAADAKPVQAEMGRCLAAACCPGSLRKLRLGWLGTTQMRLGAELAMVGSTQVAGLTHLSLSAWDGTLHLACPLQRLAALKQLTVTGVSRWDPSVQLPPSITFLELGSAMDAHHHRLPNQLSALTDLARLDVDMHDDTVSFAGCDVLRTLSSLRNLSIGVKQAWPAVLEHLTSLHRLELKRVRRGQFGLWAGALDSEAFDRTLRALGALTTLCISPGVRRPNDPRALTCCASLATLWEGASARFAPDVWPLGLQAVHTTWAAVLACAWGADTAEELRLLSIDVAHSFQLGSLAARHAAAWEAFWSWAAQAPELRSIEIHGVRTESSPMALSLKVRALRQRRPGLRILIRPAKCGQRHFEERAAALMGVAR